MYGLDLDDGSPPPLFVAMSNGEGGIAGYSELALLNGDAYAAGNPEEAIEMSAYGGLVFRVFNTRAEVVGFFATGNDPGGFTDEAGKSDYLAHGYRYLEGSTPSPEPAP